VRSAPLHIDYSPPPYWQGTIARVTYDKPQCNPVYHFLADDGFAALHEWWPGMSHGAPYVVCVVWDGATRLMSLERPAGTHSWAFVPGNITEENPAICGVHINNAERENTGVASRCTTVHNLVFGWQTPNVGDKLTVMPMTGYTLNVSAAAAAGGAGGSG
jgi:hypothetical protein